MYEPMVFLLFAIIVLTAVYFYIQRRKQQGAFTAKSDDRATGTSPEDQA